MTKKIVNCIFHEEKTPSMIIEDGRFHCLSCGKTGNIEPDKDDLYEKNKIWPGNLREDFVERCNDQWPLKIYLKHGLVIECSTENISFYEDYFHINIHKNGSAKILKPKHMESAFIERYLKIPYSEIMMIADYTS